VTIPTVRQCSTTGMAATLCRISSLAASSTESERSEDDRAVGHCRQYGSRLQITAATA
jgi:hypothetical protein